jgi:hypothetical protein
MLFTSNYHYVYRDVKLVGVDWSDLQASLFSTSQQ